MPGKDIDQVRAVAAEFGLHGERAKQFGRYIEGCKASGEYGSGRGGDFTYAELCEKATEFLGRKS